jgi:hypothetical protein
MDDEQATREFRKAAKQAKAEQDEIYQTYRDLLAVPRGRKFLWHLLEIGKFGTQPHTNNALSTAFNCGELNVGQRMFAEMTEADPAGFVRMQQERLDAARRNADERNAGNADAGDAPDYD